MKKFLMYILILACVLLAGAYLLRDVQIVLVDSTGVYFTYFGVPFIL